jgi:hypothetical protein
MTDAEKNLKLLKWCLAVLDLEAQAADDWIRPPEKCPSWFSLRAQLRDRIKELSEQK